MWEDINHGVPSLETANSSRSECVSRRNHWISDVSGREVCVMTRDQVRLRLIYCLYNQTVLSRFQFGPLTLGRGYKHLSSDWWWWWWCNQWYSSYFSSVFSPPARRLLRAQTLSKEVAEDKKEEEKMWGEWGERRELCSRALTGPLVIIISCHSGLLWRSQS